MLNLVRLSRMTGNKDLEDRAKALGKAFAGRISRMPAGHTMFMVVLDWVFHDSCEIVIIGAAANLDTRQMLNIARSAYLPNKIILFRSPVTTSQDITDRAPFTKEMVMMNGKATAYVCSGQTCMSPTNDINVLKQLLRHQD
jgi:uncharacterized protein YyaL (SSP411 family)